MRYELTDHEWAAIKPMLPNKPRGVPRANDRSNFFTESEPINCPFH
jgi:transposase